MRTTEGPQKETGQLGGFNDETGAQSRVHTNRNRLLCTGSLSPSFPLTLSIWPVARLLSLSWLITFNIKLHGGGRLHADGAHAFGVRRNKTRIVNSQPSFGCINIDRDLCLFHPGRSWMSHGDKIG